LSLMVCTILLQNLGALWILVVFRAIYTTQFRVDMLATSFGYRMAWVTLVCALVLETLCICMPKKIRLMSVSGAVLFSSVVLLGCLWVSVRPLFSIML
jgi:hypothetical protein